MKTNELKLNKRKIELEKAKKVVSELKDKLKLQESRVSHLEVCIEVLETKDKVSVNLPQTKSKKPNTTTYHHGYEDENGTAISDQAVEGANYIYKEEPKQEQGSVIF